MEYLWDAVDEVIDRYYKNRRYVKNVDDILRVVIQANRYTGDELLKFAQEYRLMELAEEIEDAIGGDEELREAYGEYTDTELENLWRMVRAICNLIPKPSSRGGAKLRPGRKPRISGEVRVYREMIVYDTRTELIKFYAGEELLFNGKCVTGYDTERSWIKIVKGKDIILPQDSHEEAKEIVNKLRFKKWPITGRFGNSAIVITARK
jgi:hypothetical protein